MDIPTHGTTYSRMARVPTFRDGRLPPAESPARRLLIHGVAITAIALFEGYDAPPTAEGVSGATTRTVVTSSLAVLALDFVLTAFMFRGLN